MARSSSDTGDSSMDRGTTSKAKIVPTTPEVVAQSLRLRTFVDKKQDSVNSEVPRYRLLRENVKTMQAVLERMLETLDNHVEDINDRNKVSQSWRETLIKHQMPVLKSMCKENGLPVGGCKLDLISRLLHD